MASPAWCKSSGPNSSEKDEFVMPSNGIIDTLADLDIEFDPAMKPAAAAAYIASDVGTMSNWRCQGFGPDYVKYGKNGSVAYRKSALDAFMESCTVETRSVVKSGPKTTETGARS